MLSYSMNTELHVKSTDAEDRVGVLRGACQPGPLAAPITLSA